MLLAHLPTLHGQWFHHITDEETRTFVIANHRLERVVWQRVQPQDLLHLGNEPARQLTDAPLPIQVRLEFVFLSIRPTPT